MQTIWKFNLEISDMQTLSMPEGATILDVQIQDGVPCLWAIVDTQAVTVERVIEICGTGSPMHVDMGVRRKHISTFQQPPFVWHVFERL